MLVKNMRNTLNMHYLHKPLTVVKPLLALTKPHREYDPPCCLIADERVGIFVTRTFTWSMWITEAPGRSLSVLSQCTHLCLMQVHIMSTHVYERYLLHPCTCARKIRPTNHCLSDKFIILTCDIKSHSCMKHTHNDIYDVRR